VGGEVRRGGVTLDQVARVAGVSPATVSRVVNGTRNVDPALQQIVMSAVKATGYVPNRAARSLVTRRSGTIALVVSAASADGFDDPFISRILGDPFFGRVAAGALDLLRTNGLRLELLIADDPATRNELTRRLALRDIDGALVVSMNTRDPLCVQLASHHLPVVLLGPAAKSVGLTTVAADNRAGGSLAAAQLLSRGRRRVGVIAGPSDARGAAERTKGFLATMARQGVEDVAVVIGGYTVQTGEASMRELLAGRPDLDGLFAANDLMAQGALHVLRDHDLHIPDQVAVVGFDDSRAATDARPTLTTVRQPLEQMAAEMVRLLLQLIDDEATPIRTTVFQPTLVVRASA
jgi:DNA-binding LacI/PurR family transcriptional regulator